MVNWNTIFDTKGTVTETGYTIEMALPFKSLQYTEDGDWTVSMTRKVPFSWSQVQSSPAGSKPSTVILTGRSTGKTPPKQGAGVWVQPTISGINTMERVNDMLQWQEQDLGIMESLRRSLDLRWGLTSETVLTATVNPDFSQVEGDVRQINLNQRFAFFYPERRPFSSAIWTPFKIQPVLCTLALSSVHCMEQRLLVEKANGISVYYQH